MLGTGHPWHAVHGGFTPMPLVGLLLSLILLRFVAKVPIGIPTFLVCVALGTLFSSAAEAWGLTLSLAIWTFAAISLDRSIRGFPSAFGGNHPD
jgi:hypothetical protein